MHASILFTVASLFLIGSYSLPQPMNLEATRSIKERGVHYEHGSHTMSAQAIQWCNDHPNVCSYYSSGSNSTTMVKRQAPQDHYQLPDGMTWEDFKKYWKQGNQGHDGYGGSTGGGTNGTTTKTRKWRE